jgi:3'-5' exonuclease
MTKVIVDIETIGSDFDSLDKKSQEYLLKYAENEEKEEDIKKRLNLYPLTGEVAAIGMLNPDSGKGCVLFQSGDEKIEKIEESGITYETGSEEEILSKFWENAKSYDQVITFNGRSFDLPFLMVRSAVRRIRPSKNFMGYRYDWKTHCDLMDQLNFYGATRKYSLDFYAKRLGLKSSKSDGVDGSMVGEMFQQGKYLEIARYCAKDLFVTKELWEIWDGYMGF